MHKKWLLATALVAGSALLAGCAAGGEATGSDEEVTITYVVWAGTQTPAMKEIAEAFEKENPNINVEVQELPWPQYWSTLQTGAAGWNRPRRVLDARAADPSVRGRRPAARHHRRDRVRGRRPGELPAGRARPLRPGRRQALRPAEGLRHERRLLQQGAVRRGRGRLSERGLDLGGLPRDRGGADRRDGVWGVAAPLDYQGGYYNSIFQAGGQVISDDGKTAEIDSPEAHLRHQVLDRPAGRRLVADAAAALGHRWRDDVRAGQGRDVRLGCLLGAEDVPERGDPRRTSTSRRCPSAKQRATVTSGIANVGYVEHQAPGGGQEVPDLRER